MTADKTVQFWAPKVPTMGLKKRKVEMDNLES
jgi:hypothetical protein